MPLILFWGYPTFPPLNVIPAYLALGVIMLLVQIPEYQAFKENDTSVVNCLWTLGKIILPFAAFLFLGEKLSWSQYLGFFLMLGCSLINTVSSVIEKYIITEDTNWINLSVYVNIFSTIMTSFLLFNRKCRTDIKSNAKPFIVCWKHFIVCRLPK